MTTLQSLPPYAPLPLTTLCEVLMGSKYSLQIANFALQQRIKSMKTTIMQQSLELAELRQANLNICHPTVQDAGHPDSDDDSEELTSLRAAVLAMAKVVAERDGEIEWLRRQGTPAPAAEDGATTGYGSRGLQGGHWGLRQEGSNGVPDKYANGALPRDEQQQDDADDDDGSSSEDEERAGDDGEIEEDIEGRNWLGGHLMCVAPSTDGTNADERDGHWGGWD